MKKEADVKSKIFPYEDIVALPHPTSAKHPRMSIHDRAAQFAPFAALTGHDDAVREAARLTQSRVEPDEQLKAVLDEKLRTLQEHIAQLPELDVAFFLPDLYKFGGEYVSHRGRLRRIDPLERCLIFADGKAVAIEDIISIDIKDI